MNIFLLKKNFPEVPVIKVAIINLQKTGIKLKKNETDLDFQERIKNEYVCNQDLIRWHIYMAEEFDEDEDIRLISVIQGHGTYGENKDLFRKVELFT